MKNVISLMISLGVISGYVQPSYGLQIELSAGTMLQDLKTGEVQTVTSSKIIDLKKQDPLLLKTENGLPVLVYSPENKNSKIKIDDIDLRAIIRPMFKEEINTSLNELIKTHTDIQILLKQRKFDQAVASAQTMQKKYTTVALGYMLEGTAQFLMGNKDLAVRSLEQGLRLDPSDTKAKELLNEIKRGSR